MSSRPIAVYVLISQFLLAGLFDYTSCQFRYNDDYGDDYSDTAEYDNSTSLLEENKLQKLISDGIDSAIKSALPTILRAGEETEISPKCMNSMMAVMNALRAKEMWAFQSKQITLSTTSL